MSANSKIEWTDHTFNPWEGCQKVGPGCDHCYAETRNARFGGGTAVNWGHGAPRRRTSVKNWNLPLKWNAAADTFMAEHGRRQRVFCSSLADVFDNAVDPQWRADLFALIAATPNLDWLLLTKRIGNVPKMLGDYKTLPLLPNIWLGATIVNQEEADRDIPKLLAVPARVRFLSMEPLLGPVDLTYVDDGHAHRDVPREEWGSVDNDKSPPGLWWNVLTGKRTIMHGGADGEWSRTDAAVDWVIVGGESGPGARPMHPEWARSLRDQCEAADVPFLFKQWGEWTPGENVEKRVGTVDGAWWVDGRWMPSRENLASDDDHRDDEPDLYRIGKKAAGRQLDGRTWDEFPDVLPSRADAFTTSDGSSAH